MTKYPDQGNIVFPTQKLSFYAILIYNVQFKKKTIGNQKRIQNPEETMLYPGTEQNNSEAAKL